MAGRRGLWIVMLVSLSCARAGELVQNFNPETGLSSWRVVDQGLSLELVQLYPDYVQAVFSSRGLPPEVAKKVSTYCVFGTIIRNESDAPISNRAVHWRFITRDGVQHPPRTKSEWISEWRTQGIGFRWLLLAEDQTYDVGDWGQGFTTVNLPPGTWFDLQYSWSLNDTVHTQTLHGLQCAPVRQTDE